MNTDSFGHRKDGVAVRASIQIDGRELVLGAEIPKHVFYRVFAEVGGLVAESMLDDGLREEAECVAEMLDLMEDIRVLESKKEGACRGGCTGCRSRARPSEEEPEED